MQGAAVGAVLDLRAAAEAIGEDQRVRRRFANLRQQQLLAGLDRDLVALAAFVPERSREPAAAGLEHLVIEAEPVEDPPIAVDVARRALMAVEVHERPALELRQLPVRRALREELAERERPARAAPGVPG